MKRYLCLFACLAVLLSAAGCDLLREQLQATGIEKTEIPGDERWRIASEVETESYDINMGMVLGADSATSQFNATGRGMAPSMWQSPQEHEEYTPVFESGFSATLNNPLSTFAADVDTASYANIRRMIRQQRSIPADAVRIEEMINAFTYRYPAPKGDDPLAVSAQVAICPWNDQNLLLRVGLKAQEINTTDLPPSNLVFLIDVSGSMDMPEKLPLVQRSFALLTEQLTARDRVSIVVYAGTDAVVLDGVRGDEKAKILEAIYELKAGGSTNGAAGIVTAYDIALKYDTEGVNSRVILATDGDFNVGISSENELIRLIEEQRKLGIFLTVLGYGYGNLKDNNLESLAKRGNGNATYIDTIHQARRALVEEMGATLNTVAKDVKIQVEFNPAVVGAYRLIGYEHRRLAAEDFADDTKDGGEMGAGHCVTALYELIPAGTGTVPSIPLTYQKTQSTESTDYGAVHVRYKQPRGEISTEIVLAVAADRYTDIPDDDFQLASAVATFGQLISGSKYAGNADQRMVLDMLQPLLSGDTGGRIVELYDLVRTSGGLYKPGAVEGD